MPRKIYITENKILTDKKPINTLRLITNISLVIGVIIAITIWSAIEADYGIIFGILALFSSVLIWALLSVVCDMSENLIDIRYSVTTEYAKEINQFNR